MLQCQLQAAQRQNLKAPIFTSRDLWTFFLCGPGFHYVRSTAPALPNSGHAAGYSFTSILWAHWDESSEITVHKLLCWLSPYTYTVVDFGVLLSGDFNM